MIMNRNIPRKRIRIEARSSEPWIRHGIIYELFPRSFSKSGTIDGIINKIPYLKKLGVSILWIMPIHPIGSVKRKGRLGSPYSVKDYYQINDEIGSIAKFKQLVKHCHKNKLRIIIDLVIGHTAWDSALFIQHPEWFKKNKSGRFQSPVPEWTDVVAFNYSNKRLVRYMIELMKYWIEFIGVDGFRCDDAGRIPIRFWELARDSIEQHHILMLAESDKHPLHHRKAFDLSYGTDFYLTLRDVIKGNTPASHLHTMIAQEQSIYPKGSLLLRFTSNHDTNNQGGSDINLFGLKGSKLAAVVNNTIPGVPMLYNGQESGNGNKLDLFDATKISKTRKGNFSAFYKRLFLLRKQYPALIDGRYVHISTSDNEHCFTFCRVLNNNSILIATNFTKKKKLLDVIFPAEMDIEPNSIKCTNLFTEQREYLNRINSKSFILTLPSFGFKIISIKQNK